MKRTLCSMVSLCLLIMLISVPVLASEEATAEPAEVEPVSLLTLTVDGVETDIESGVVYEGDIVLTYTDKMPIYGHEASMADWAGSDYRAALYLDEDGLNENASVLAAAPEAVYDNGVLSVGPVRSVGSTFNAVIVNGGTHEIKDADIVFDGDGGNDFNGYGAALLITADSEVVLDNISIDTTGLTRGAMAAADEAKVLVMNSAFAAHPGILPDDYVFNAENVSGAMKAAPWCLGIDGTNRATNLLGSAASTYFNSDIYSGGWGICSADDAVAPVMTIVNSKLHSDGDSVYGAFGIGDGSDIRILGSEFDVTGILVNLTAGTLLVGQATPEHLEGVFGADRIMTSDGWDPARVSVLKCSRVGIQPSGGSTAVIEPGTIIETGFEAFRSKGGNTQVFVDGASITAKNGIIVQLMDSDDAGADFLDPAVPIHASYNEADLTPVYIEGRDLTACDHDYGGQTLSFEDFIFGKSLVINGSSGLAAEFSFSNMTLDGDFYNSTESFTTEEKLGVESCASNLFLTFENAVVNGVISASLAEHYDPDTGETIKTVDEWDEIGTVRNTARPVINNGVSVYLSNGSVWNVTGTSYLSELVIGDGCAVNGLITVDGASVDGAPGIYTGAITIEPAA